MSWRFGRMLGTWLTNTVLIEFRAWMSLFCVLVRDAPRCLSHDCHPARRAWVPAGTRGSGGSRHSAIQISCATFGTAHDPLYRPSTPSPPHAVPPRAAPRIQSAQPNIGPSIRQLTTTSRPVSCCLTSEEPFPSSVIPGPDVQDTKTKTGHSAMLRQRHPRAHDNQDTAPNPGMSQPPPSRRSDPEPSRTLNAARTPWMFYAIASGACAAFNGVFAKLCGFYSHKFPTYS